MIKYQVNGDGIVYNVEPWVDRKGLIKKVSKKINNKYSEGFKLISKN